MSESRTFKILDKTIIFTLDESIPDNSVYVDVDGNIKLKTLKELDDLFNELPFLPIKVIKYRMNSTTEPLFAKMQSDKAEKMKQEQEALQLNIKAKREKVADTKAIISASLKKMNDEMPSIRGFNLEMMGEIEGEIAKLEKSKKIDPSALVKFEQKKDDLNKRTNEEQTKSWKTHDSCVDIISKKFLEANASSLFFNESMDPEFEAILLNDRYTYEVEEQLNKNMRETTALYREIYDNLKILNALISKKLSATTAEKRSRNASVSSAESEGSAGESSEPKDLKLASKATLLPPLPRHPVLQKKAKSTTEEGAEGIAEARGAEPRGAEARGEARGAEPRVAEARGAEPRGAEAVTLEIEPKKARDILRFTLVHLEILKRLFSEAILKLIKIRLEVFGGIRNVSESVASSPEIDAILRQIILFREQVVDEPLVIETESIWRDLDRASRLLKGVSQKVGACGGGGGGCPEAAASDEVARLTESRRNIWIRTEASVLETLIAQIQADGEIAIAAERDGWVAQTYKVANYGEFIEYIRSKAAAVGLVVENGKPKDPSRDPRPAIYIKTNAETQLHITISPDLLSSGKFHMTHNNLPKEFKRFYFSIKYDPGHGRPYIVATGTSVRIEFAQIAQRFIDELTRNGLPTKGINEEVRQLLEFLMSNMETKSTKRRGGYFEKYMKYKAKYLALKQDI